MSRKNCRKRTIMDYFGDDNQEDIQPPPKRIKLVRWYESPSPPAPPQLLNQDTINKRSKQRVEELKETKLEEEKQQHLKQQLREEIASKIQNMAENIRSDPIKLIKLFCPTLDIKENISSKTDIQKAFKKALVHCHPDKAINKSLREQVKTEEIFKLLCAEKQKYENNSERIRMKNTFKNTTDFEKYYKNKIFISSENTSFDVKIIISKDRKFVFVKGKTYPIKEELKQCGLGWNPKQNAWQIKRPYFSDFMRLSIKEICINHGYSVSISVDDRKDIYLESKEYDFRIWYENDSRAMLVTPHKKMNDFWRREGFIRIESGVWIQTESVFYEGYLDVIKDIAKQNGLVFGYYNVEENPKCKFCNIRMSILTTKHGAAWNYGRKFFKCFKCGTFLWIDGTEAYSDAAFRRCGEHGGYHETADCRMM